jgi:predicted MFS family arabinose efflux permease
MTLSAEIPASASGVLVGEALRTSRFWKLAAIFMLLTAMLAGTAVNLPVILRQRGADAQTAASIMSVIGISMFSGRVWLGLMLDRWFAGRITMVITIVPIMGFALMMFTVGKMALILAAACIGFSLGAEYSMSAYIISRAFGFRAFGVIYGLMTVAMEIGLASAVWAISGSLIKGVGDKSILSGTLALLILALLITSTIRKKDLPFLPRPNS